MMRLGLDLLFLIPDETGGRETYARELISALDRLQPELSVTVFLNRDTPSSAAPRLGPGMTIVRLPISARRPEQWALGELGLLPVAARRAGIDVLHSLANFAPVSGRFRRVISVHDLQYRAVPDLLPPARRIGTTVLLEAAARHADRLITGSRASRDELVRELAVPPDRIDVIANGVGLAVSATPVSEDELRGRHRLGSRPVALAVASNLPHKNLGALIEALAHLRGPVRPILVIAGPGTDDAGLRARALAAGVQDDIRLLGFRPAAELEGLYRLANCALLASLYEGFGLPVLEAMSRGVPVACSDIPALREVAGGAALLFSPERPDEIAGTLRDLCTDEGLRRRLIGSGLQRAQSFSWEHAARATLACYERALAAPERSRWGHS